MCGVRVRAYMHAYVCVWLGKLRSTYCVSEIMRSAHGVP